MDKIGTNRIVYDREKLGKRFVNVLGKTGTHPRKKTASAPSATGNTVDLPVLAQDPSITDLPLEKFSIPNVAAVDDPDLGKVLTGNKVSSYIDGVNVARPGTLYPVGDPRFDQQMALAVVTRLHDLYEKILERRFDWNQGQKQILVQVRAGNEPNSDYAPGDPSSPNPIDRLDRVQLYGFHDPVMGKDIFAAESKEVIAHEAGHGITDTLRPLYSMAFNLESLAFHEGQADIDAMMMDLQDDNLKAKVLQRTGGDLTKHNYLSDIGEEFGQGIADLYNLPDPFIRSADNDPTVFRMTDWRNLPFDPRNGLGSEPHTFSQVWSGAWYDNLRGLYDYFRRNVGMDSRQALQQAGEIMSDVAARQFDFSPVGDVHFDEMALAQLKALKTDFASSPYQSDLQTIFQRNFLGRRILSQAKINNWKAQENSLPALTLNGTPLTARSLARWFSQNAGTLASFDSSLTQRELSQMRIAEAYTNGKGEKFLNFVRMSPVAFTASDLSDPSLAKYKDKLLGQKLPMFGGLTLGFDVNGRLFAYNHDPISNEEIRDTKDYILALIKQGVIQMKEDPGSSSPRRPGGTSRVLAEIKSEGESGKPATFRRTSVCTGFKPVG